MDTTELKEKLKNLFWKHHTTEANHIIYTTGDTSTAFIEELLSLIHSELSKKDEEWREKVKEASQKWESLVIDMQQKNDQISKELKEINQLLATQRQKAEGKDTHE